jgi:hypothetical protein
MVHIHENITSIREIPNSVSIVDQISTILQLGRHPLNKYNLFTTKYEPNRNNPI